MTNQTMERRIVLETCTGFFIAPYIFGIDWYIIFVDYPFWRKVFLTMLRPAPILKRRSCGRSWLETIPIWTCTSYVGFGESAILADIHWKDQFFENTTDKEDPRRLSATVSFSKGEKSEDPVDCNNFSGSSFVRLPHFRFSASVVLSKLLFRWCFLYQTFPCGAQLANFLEALVLVFANNRLLCNLIERCVSILVVVISPPSRICWRTFSMHYGFMWTRITKIDPL